MDNNSLIDTLAQRLSCDKKDVDAMMMALIDVVASKCGEMDVVALPGFGSFEAKMRKERVVVMPATGKRMLVPPKISLSFKQSAILKQRLRES